MMTMSDKDLELFEAMLEHDGQQSYCMAGQDLRGAIAIGCSKPLRVHQVTLEFKGEARNGWVNKTSDKIYDSVESCMNDTTHLFRSAQTLSSGHHNLPFQHLLPHDLPSSFEGEFGNIRYLLRAVLIAGVPSREFVRERFFNVAMNLNLANYPITRHPVEAVDEIEFSCCCLPLGTVQATITIPKNGYLPNECIHINAEIYNGSRKKIEDSQIALIQHAKFIACSRYENAEDVKEMQYVVASVSKGNLRPRRTLRIKNQDLKVPEVIPTYQGNILTINYILRFEANPGIEIEIPITIGTTNCNQLNKSGKK